MDAWLWGTATCVICDFHKRYSVMLLSKILVPPNNLTCQQPMGLCGTHLSLSLSLSLSLMVWLTIDCKSGCPHLECALTSSLSLTPRFSPGPVYTSIVSTMVDSHWNNHWDHYDCCGCPKLKCLTVDKFSINHAN